jgi:hypothetical protein
MAFSRLPATPAEEVALTATAAVAVPASECLIRHTSISCSHFRTAAVAKVTAG